MHTSIARHLFAANLAPALLTLLTATLTLTATQAQAAPEQTGTPRRVLAADYSTKRLGIVNEKGLLEWEYPIRDIHDVWVLPNGHLLFQTQWTEIVEVNPQKEVVWRYDAAKQNRRPGERVEVHAFQRLADGRTLIAESGPSRLIEVDRDGTIRHEVKLKVAKSDPHRDTRLVRKLASGHYLVAHEGQGLVREYDGAGNVTWEHSVKAQVYSAERLANGHTLIGTGGGSRVIEVDPSGREVWTLEKEELPGIKLAWVTMVERLANGNTLVVNCHAGPTQPQLFEVTQDKKVVWTFKDFTHFGNSLPVARVLPPKP